MKFKLQLFIPSNVHFKTLIIEANSILDAKQIANGIFKHEFEKTGKKCHLRNSAYSKNYSRSCLLSKYR